MGIKIPISILKELWDGKYKGSRFVLMNGNRMYCSNYRKDENSWKNTHWIMIIFDKKNRKTYTHRVNGKWYFPLGRIWGSINPSPLWNYDNGVCIDKEE